MVNEHLAGFQNFDIFLFLLFHTLSRHSFSELFISVKCFKKMLMEMRKTPSTSPFYSTPFSNVLLEREDALQHIQFLTF